MDVSGAYEKLSYFHPTQVIFFSPGQLKASKYAYIEHEKKIKICTAASAVLTYCCIFRNKADGRLVFFHII